MKRNPWDVASEIRELIDNPGGSHHSGAARSSRERQRSLQDRLARDFGAIWGWKLTRTGFGLDYLARGILRHDNILPPYVDHPYWYREGRVPRAIVWHSYQLGDPETRERMVAEYGGIAPSLDVEFPDFPSWHFPGVTTLVMVRRG